MAFSAITMIRRHGSVGHLSIGRLMPRRHHMSRKAREIVASHPDAYSFRPIKMTPARREALDRARRIENL